MRRVTRACRLRSTDIPPDFILVLGDAIRVVESGSGCLREAMRFPADIEAHRQLQLGAAMAGMAGNAIAVVLPTVLRHNATRPAVARAYRELTMLSHLCSRKFRMKKHWGIC